MRSTFITGNINHDYLDLPAFSDCQVSIFSFVITKCFEGDHLRLCQYPVSAQNLTH